jgi:hypothetical protein
MCSNRNNNVFPIRESNMPPATRTTKSLSLEKDVLKEIERTKGDSSTSERVNCLLKVGLEVERRQCLHTEAAAFFKTGEDRAPENAFQSASIKSLARED